MAKRLTQYRVFIGSPGGLDQERRCFRSTLRKYTDVNAEPRDVIFHPIGWEDTHAGVGRPQELINDDLKRCDYAVFVLHDRWGSPSEDSRTSRTEGEIALAEELYRANRLRNIVLFFRKVSRRQMNDPGEQLRRVLEFKKRIKKEEKYLFVEYDDIKQFSEILESHLAQWLRGHEKQRNTFSDNGFVTSPTFPSGDSPIVTPNFNYWITEAKVLLEAPTPDYENVLFCATKATVAASSDVEWAQGANITGIALFHLEQPDQAIATFSAITERLTDSTDRDHG
jgi:hypothetical protein